jgi:hypothetical protein
MALAGVFLLMVWTGETGAQAFLPPAGAFPGIAVNDTLQLFAAAAKTVWGENVHPVRALNAGANLHFRFRAARLPDRQGS